MVGFLAASWVAVQDERALNWTWFLITAAVAVLGVGIAQRAVRAHKEDADTVTSNIEDIDRSLKSIVEKVTQLNSQKGEINTYDIRHKIDEMLLDDLNTFVEARETIGVRYGLNAYAEVMSHYAAGERYLNRIWSASADGYIDEVNKFLDRAQEQFTDTQKVFKDLQAQHRPT
jgi:hypothetical protein